MYQFEKLEIWQESLDLVAKIYKLTKGFPDEEKFGLSNQMRRAAISVSLNIAEGRGKSNDKDFCRYLSISTGSLFEVVASIKVSVRLGYVTEAQIDEVLKMSDRLVAKIKSLQNSISKNNKPKKAEDK